MTLMKMRTRYGGINALYAILPYKVSCPMVIQFVREKFKDVQLL